MPKPPPPGFERHWCDPNFIRKVTQRTVASDIYPYLKSSMAAPTAPIKEERLSNAERKHLSPLGGLAK